MSVYGNISSAANTLADAIRELAKRPVYNIIVNTGADAETISQAISDAVERLDARAKTQDD